MNSGWGILAGFGLGVGAAGALHLPGALGMAMGALAGACGGYLLAALRTMRAERRARRPREMRPSTIDLLYARCDGCLHYRARDARHGDCHLIGNPPVTADSACDRHLERWERVA